MGNFAGLDFLARSGGEWVIYLLFGCSILSVAVIIEHAVLHWRLGRGSKNIDLPLSKALAAGDWDSARELLNKQPGPLSRLVAVGLDHLSNGLASMEEHIAAATIRERHVLEKRLLILGTLGNNAPFIGLFGTVLGVIKAFHDLSFQADAGPEVVMAGLSEALVATAVGLLVAIPSVMAYNYFKKRVNDLFDQSEARVRLMAARLKAPR